MMMDSLDDAGFRLRGSRLGHVARTLCQKNLGQATSCFQFSQTAGIPCLHFFAYAPGIWSSMCHCQSMMYVVLSSDNGNPNIMDICILKSLRIFMKMDS